ncbi:MAG: hypothetical protein AB8F95_11000, partial [Bacteroidia bacterium]
QKSDSQGLVSQQSYHAIGLLQRQAAQEGKALKDESIRMIESGGIQTFSEEVFELESITHRMQYLDPRNYELSDIELIKTQILKTLVAFDDTSIAVNAEIPSNDDPFLEHLDWEYQLLTTARKRFWDDVLTRLDQHKIVISFPASLEQEGDSVSYWVGGFVAREDLTPSFLGRGLRVGPGYPYFAKSTIHKKNLPKAQATVRIADITGGYTEMKVQPGWDKLRFGKE